MKFMKYPSYGLSYTSWGKGGETKNKAIKWQYLLNEARIWNHANIKTRKFGVENSFITKKNEFLLCFVLCFYFISFHIAS